MALKLVKLTYEYKKQLTDMLDEWLAAEQDFSPYAIRRLDYHDFDTYLANLEHRTREGLFVPDSVYFLLDTERNICLGAANLRHELGARNCVTGGHIGDGIRPSERRKGYATAMIGMVLEECRKMGLSKILMTCDPDNIGSAKSIMRNGGVYESTVTDEGETQQRYWITLHEEVVETERLRLTREMPADYTDMAAWTCDPDTYTYLLSSVKKDPAEVLPWLYRHDPNSRTDYLMLLRSRVDGHAVGSVSLRKDAETGVWEFGYVIAPNDRGNGYAVEAISAMMRYLTDLNGAQSFEGECALANTASRRVMEKLGLRPLRDSRYQKTDGTEFASVVYGN